MTPTLRVIGISQVVMFGEEMQITQMILEKNDGGQQIAVPISDEQALEIIGFATGEQDEEQTEIGSPVSDELEAGTQL